MKPEVSDGLAGQAVHTAANGEEARDTSTRTHDRVGTHARHRGAAQQTAAAQNSNKKRNIALAAVLTLIVGCAGILAYQFFQGKATPAAAAQSPPPVVTVSTAVSKEQTVDDTLTVTGSVSAWDPLSVGTEVSNLRITDVKVEEGDIVKKGQPLALLNSALLEAQLSQAKARLQSSQSSLTKAIQPNRQEDILALKAALAQAEANTAQEEAMRKQAQVNLADAEINADRYQELATVGATSPEIADAKQLAFDQARQALAGSDAKIKAAHFLEDQARQKLLEATRGGRTEDVDISKAMLAEMRGQIKALQEQIAETVIRAPDDGLIAARSAHIGDISTAGKTLFSIIRLNKLELRAQVSDLDLSKFRVGQPVSISTTEDQPAQAEGKVWLVSPEVDQSSRLGTVRIQLPPNAGLKPGMFVRGEVNLGQRKAVTVPVTAVVTRNGESFVFTLSGDRVASNPISVGVQTDTIAEITKGLKPGTKVVTKGARFLSDNDVVRVSD